MSDVIAPAEPLLLQQARQSVQAQGLPFSGMVAPRDAWQLMRAGEALLVDVRSAEERHFVGHVPSSVHVPWTTETALTRNPRFVKELDTHAGRDRTLLLMCRSGKRSALAAEAALKVGFTQVFKIAEGFEGDQDDAKQRGHFNGRRFHGLPWVQD